MIRNFKINIILRISLMVLVVFSGFYIFYENYNLILLNLFLMLLFLYQIFSLFQFLDTTNRELARFLTSIKYSDYTQNFSSKKLNGSFEELYKSFNQIIQKFQDTRNEKEENFHFMQTVLQHLAVGLLSFDKNGKVEFINKSAKKLLHIPYLKNLNKIKHNKPELYESLINLKTSEKITFKLVTDDEIQHLFFYATEFKIRNKDFKLIAIQNIQSELEEKEMEAWQNLIRVLTHEIMNSVTPISSLSGTVKNILEDNNNICKETESFNDIIQAITAIKKRSEGLIHFVESYQNLTRIPKPDFKNITVINLLERVSVLMNDEINKNQISFNYSCKPVTLKVAADAELIEQVLINLILNSISALKNQKNPKIELTAGINEFGKVLLKVSDNGSGINSEILEKIFIPFFSTRENGSGIGLSISKQILRLHRGRIKVSSIPNEETTFTLIF